MSTKQMANQPGKSLRTLLISGCIFAVLPSIALSARFSEENDFGTVAISPKQVSPVSVSGKDLSKSKKYKFTKIADNYTPGTDFSYFEWEPSLNDATEVVFQAGLVKGGEGVFTSSHGKIKRISDTAHSAKKFTDFRNANINNNHTVAFFARN